MPNPEQIGMEHVSFEVGTFAELQQVYRKFKEHNVRFRQTIFHGVAKSIYFYDPDGNVLEVYCNVPPEEYRKTVSNPYYNYDSIEDERKVKSRSDRAPSRRNGESKIRHD
jgi:catechol 2,3-dioxygenase